MNWKWQQNYKLQMTGPARESESLTATYVQQDDFQRTRKIIPIDARERISLAWEDEHMKLCVSDPVQIS